ncbi:hypothetical protein BpJC7_26990 [Weizmannia acidilactici]|uniref:Uncharacterized protein n=1 Tax=Weizmannia acidilactici TaxID=2607726 RepID=A0A5J4J976_9BACI|nr:hypothetical protein BpJC7_26990 [Weizmannia acidilactici]
MPELGWAIILVIIMKAVFSFWQEFKAEQATESLKKMLPSYCESDPERASAKNPSKGIGVRGLDLLGRRGLHAAPRLRPCSASGYCPTDS